MKVNNNTEQFEWFFCVIPVVFLFILTMKSSLSWPGFISYQYLYVIKKDVEMDVGFFWLGYRGSLWGIDIPIMLSDLAFDIDREIPLKSELF